MSKVKKRLDELLLPTSSSITEYQNLVFRFEPRTKAQQEAIQAYKKARVLFLLGPAGVGKNVVSMGLALTDYFNKQIEKIYLTRPCIEAGEKLGFLPGELNEKVAPYMVPFQQAMGALLFGKLDKNVLDPAPLAYLRGYTFRNCVSILDEAQNVTFKDLKLYLTRLGKNSKMIIAGDPDQSDIPSGGDDLLDVVERLEGTPGVEIIDFDESDIVRDPMVKLILERLDS